jgi:hypothetical protein
MKKKAIFVSQHILCGNGNINPKPSIKHLPDWYKNFSKYGKKDGTTGSLKDVKNNIAFPTFKSCVPMFDAMTAGYMYDTPCDLEVIWQNGVPLIKTEPGWEDFIGFRGKTEGFPLSSEYAEEHFNWMPPWAIKLPEGYSGIYLTPINRLDLPFYSFEGIIDNDKVVMTGQYPFIIKKSFVGIIPKGTPFLQVIPFKREDWESEVNILKPLELAVDRNRTPFKYRKARANYYRKNEWQRKNYE